MVLALPELILLAALIFALALTRVNQDFAAALFETVQKGVGWIPWIGKKASNGVMAVAKRVDNVFGTVALKLEGAITSTWHVLATLIEMTGDAIWKATKLGYHVWWLVQVKYPISTVSWFAHKGFELARAGGKVTNVTVQKVTKVQGISAKQYRDLLKRVAKLSATVGLLAATLAPPITRPNLPPLTVPKWIKGLRGRVGRLEHKFKPLVFTALVAGVLTKLGLHWLRCDKNKKLAKRNCSMDTDLFESLLGSTLLLTSAISLEQLARELQEPAELVTGAMHNLVREF